MVKYDDFITEDDQKKSQKRQKAETLEKRSTDIELHSAKNIRRNPEAEQVQVEDPAESSGEANEEVNLRQGEAPEALLPRVAEQYVQHSKEDMKQYPFREVIDSLMYLAVGTRPDIAFSANSLSQYNTCYTKQHWVAAKRVLRYIKGTLRYGLTFKKTGIGLQGCGCRLGRVYKRTTFVHRLCFHTWWSDD